MNKTLIWTGILVIAVVLGINAAAFVSPMLSPSQTASLSYSAQQQTFVAPPVVATIQPTLAAPSQNGGYQRGYGMGHGMMGNYEHGYGMMGGYRNNQSAPSAVPLTADQAKTAAEAYIQSSGLTGLKVAEIMAFDNNAYVAVTESQTGQGAFELLVDPYSPQFAYPEYGPNMMWNLKYGMMGGRGGMGMMGNWNGRNINPANTSAQMNVTQEQAIQFAQTYLDQFVPGAIATADPLAFYGYYTLDFEKNGQVIGMLSVNGFTGQVFPHTWHNLFISETRYDQ